MQKQLSYLFMKIPLTVVKIHCNFSEKQYVESPAISKKKNSFTIYSLFCEKSLLLLTRVGCTK